MQIPYFTREILVQNTGQQDINLIYRLYSDLKIRLNNQTNTPIVLKSKAPVWAHGSRRQAGMLSPIEGAKIGLLYFFNRYHSNFKSYNTLDKVVGLGALITRMRAVFWVGL
jgi:hypothetical protein